QPETQDTQKSFTQTLREQGLIVDNTTTEKPKETRKTEPKKEQSKAKTEPKSKDSKKSGEVKTFIDLIRSEGML
uniref:hypothetical protein n=1 Tax=uncultured Methanosphaera sp. TaxID=262501 RepID=UPI0025914EA1